MNGVETNFLLEAQVMRRASPGCRPVKWLTRETQ